MTGLDMGSPLLRIRLLGGLHLRYDETPIPALDSARTESLLVYLLLHREVRSHDSDSRSCYGLTLLRPRRGRTSGMYFIPFGA